jgi:hypothetical protein
MVTALMANEPDHTIATMGWNLLHDFRISSARFQQFADRLSLTGNSATDGPSMGNAIGDYHRSRVQRTPDPDFLSPANSNNFLGESGLPTLHPDKQLVRVLNLSGMHFVFQAAQAAGIPEFLDYDRSTTRSGHRLARTAWLDRQFAEFVNAPERGRMPERLRANPLLNALTRHLNASRHSSHYEPAWVTLWSDFQKRDWQRPERWSKLVGLTSPSEASWLLLLRYPVRQAGRLVRPTQLDSGWYPEHFPIPPSALTGHAMEMDGTRPDALPLPEFIHQQIDHDPSIWSSWDA